ncbi:helix-turn-helix domain-containing protein [Pseudoduganella namucuonensis]|uniref:Helix-turn-helix n=1 Tax=Pseudoduganella namucuonensis TaxID=1035707 RepID=A0A1I7LT46_9BURK|nr:helix-turn-helix domain-containing protein [Pseudoduganella namucuonensis]SFV12864.1 Helix-turn-helix [Pseudoduganella namucuonensis]
MRTTGEYLDLIKVKLRLPSDYAVAKVLGITHVSVSNLRNGKSSMGIETAMKVAEILGVDEHQIYSDGQFERAKTPELLNFWKAISDKFSASFTDLLSGCSPRRYRVSAR